MTNAPDTDCTRPDSTDIDSGVEGLYIKRYGRGPRKVVGYHGWGADHLKSFAAVIEALPADTAFYGVDLPGYGRSEVPDVFSYPIVTQRLARGLDAIAADRRREGADGSASLVGACSGSYHVLETARQRPDKTDLAVLVEPLAYYPWFLRALLLPGLGKFLFKQVFDNPVGRMLTQRTLSHQRVANDYNVMESFGRLDLQVPYRYLQFYDQLGEVDQYATFQTPTRIVYGENTWKAVADSAGIWENVFPDVTVHRVDNVGHLVNQEAPDAVVEVLTR